MAALAVGRSVKDKDAGDPQARPPSSTRRPVARSDPDDILDLQRSAGNRAVSRLVQPASGTLVQSVLNGDGGRPLDQPVRAEMESRFGHDFSRVRIHTGSRTTVMATSLAARAFTVGDHIVFNTGTMPHSLDGCRLLAHELAHVVQQRRGGSAPDSDRDAAPEAEAGRAGDDLASGPTTRPIVTGTAVGVARKPMDPRHARGHAGEQAMGFERYTQSTGWVIVEGPSGGAGHGVTTKGFDAVAYNIKTDQLEVTDNKSLKAKTVYGASASAITRNLLKNLDAAIQRVTAAKDMPYRIRVLQLLRATRAAVRGGTPLPEKVSVVVTVFGGQSTGISPVCEALASGSNPRPRRRLHLRPVNRTKPPSPNHRSVKPRLPFRSSRAVPGHGLQRRQSLRQRNRRLVQPSHLVESCRPCAARSPRVCRRPLRIRGRRERRSGKAL